jgi:CubicO group peptidase (beta-lactamase class C family)
VRCLALLSIALFCACAHPSGAAAPEPSRASPANAFAPDATTHIAAVERGLTARMKALNVPALSVAVVEHYDIAWAKAWGVLDAETKTPATTDSLFQACALGMMLNAVATLKLVEEGALSLDEDVNDRLSRWKTPSNLFTRKGDKSTIRRILSHSAGYNVRGFGRGYMAGGRVPGLLQILDGELPAYNEPVRIVYVPGSKFEFSSGGVTVLQELLTEVAGVPYDVFMRNHVLIPLGMTRSTFEQPAPAAFIDQTATGHDEELTPVNGWQRTYPTQAADGLWSTPTDLARALIEIEKSAMGTSSKILKQETVRDTMLRPASPQVPHAGLGVFLLDKGGHLAFTHSGSHIGYSAMLIGYPDLGVGAVLMTNGDQGKRFYEEVLDRIATEYRWPT